MSSVVSLEAGLFEVGASKLVYSREELQKEYLRGTFEMFEIAYRQHGGGLGFGEWLRRLPVMGNVEKATAFWNVVFASPLGDGRKQFVEDFNKHLESRRVGARMYDNGKVIYFV